MEHATGEDVLDTHDTTDATIARFVEKMHGSDSPIPPPPSSAAETKTTPTLRTQRRVAVPPPPVSPFTTASDAEYVSTPRHSRFGLSIGCRVQHE